MRELAKRLPPATPSWMPWRRRAWHSSVEVASPGSLACGAGAGAESGAGREVAGVQAGG
jgi:hypothetical protein